MSITHALSTNNYGNCKIIVATNPANGTHITLAAAMSYASVGDTIFLRDSVTENVTITPGVNIAAWQGSSANTVAIIGTVTMTSAGTSTISGVKLQTNSAAAIAVTGSAASILNIVNCYLNFTNNTGITFSSSSGSSQINISNCSGDLGTTGIGIFTDTSAGSVSIGYTIFTNTGASTTASTKSANAARFRFSQFASPFSCSSTAAYSIDSSTIDCNSLNTTAVTLAGTGVSFAKNSQFLSGTATALSIGSGTALSCTDEIRVNSSNTNAIDGLGTISFGYITYSGSSVNNNVTTQTKYGIQTGTYQSLTFTPVLAFGGASTGITYSTQLGNYRIVGNMLFFNIHLTLTSNGSSTGNATITGLPVAAAAAPATMFYRPVFGGGLAFNVNFTDMTGQLAGGATSMSLRQVGSGQALTNLTEANIVDTSIIGLTGFYFI